MENLWCFLFRKFFCDAAAARDPRKGVRFFLADDLEPRSLNFCM